MVKEVMPSLQLLSTMVLGAYEGLRPFVALGIQVLDEQEVL